MKTNRVAVIGAGISGLVCGYELQKAGYHVDVFEKESTVGGRMNARQHHGHSFDLGAQIVSKSYEQALAYCRELGVPDQWRELSKLSTHLYENDKLFLASYGTLMEFLRYSYLPPLQRVRLLLFISLLRIKARNIDFFNLSTGTDYDTQNAYDFAVKRVGKDVADKVVDALVSAYHFHSSREMSLGAFLGCLNHFTRYFTFHQMIRDMSTLPNAFADKLNVHVNCPVHSVRKLASGFQVMAGDSQGGNYDLVVLATPGGVTRKLLPEVSPSQNTLLSAVQYAPTINIGFQVPSAPVQGVTLVLVPETSNDWICSYFLPQVSEGKAEKRGRTALNVFLRDARAAELMHASDATIFESVKRELLTVCPPLREYGANVEGCEMQRWPEAMPKFFPSYLQCVEQFWQKGQGEGNVYLCGDFLNTPWIEGSIRCGQRVAGLIKERGHSFLH